MIDECYPRFVSQIDRDPQSPTYGSCDRGFWMYRMHDVSSGVLQQASLTCAAIERLTRATELSGCRYLGPHSAAFCRALGEAINRFTLRLLEDSGGCLDEYYPGEKSFPASVFGGYALLKSAVLFEQTEVLTHPALLRLARFIADRGPSPAANQDVAGAAFLFLFLNAAAENFRLSADEKFALTAAAEGLALQREGKLGVFTEYGGLDIGYATVSLNYLSYILADGHSGAIAPLREVARILSYFVTPSGQLGGEYASRSTTYFLPFGLIMAAELDTRLRPYLGRLDLSGTFAKLDDRYLMHYCLPSLALSALRLRERPLSIGDGEAEEGWRQWLDFDLGLCAFQSSQTSLIVGLNKGGTLYVESRGERRIDCGYRVERGGRVYASNTVGVDGEVTTSIDDHGAFFQIRSPFYRYRVLVPSPLKTVALRVLAVWGPHLNRLFKWVLIRNAERLSGVTLIRKIAISFDRADLAVDDTIEGLGAADVLTRSPSSSGRLVPSAKFYHAGEEECFLQSTAGESALPARGNSVRDIITFAEPGRP
jgi:hypothetical protein